MQSGHHENCEGYRFPLCFSCLIILELSAAISTTGWKVNPKTLQLMPLLDGKVATSSSFILKDLCTYHLNLSAVFNSLAEVQKIFTCGFRVCGFKTWSESIIVYVNLMNSWFFMLNFPLCFFKFRRKKSHTITISHVQHILCLLVPKLHCIQCLLYTENQRCHALCYITFKVWVNRHQEIVPKTQITNAEKLWLSFKCYHANIC